jgi:amino acid adenylation domain-containing protein
VSMVELLQRLARQGVELWFEGDRLRFRAPKGALSPEQRAEVGGRRAEVLAELRRQAVEQEATFALSFSQRSLWFLHQQAPESTAYHVAMSMRVVGSVQTEVLLQSVQALVDRHAILRTTYDFVEGEPRQKVAGYRIAVLDVHERPDSSDAELRKEVEADYRRPFDLATGPVLRASLYSRSANDHVLLLTVHHIAADGWSLLILFEEFTRLYTEFTGGTPAGLPRPPLQYADYSAWQERLLAGAEGERLWAYWRDSLAAPREPLALPTDRTPPQIQSFRGASFGFELPQQLLESVKALARAQGTTPFVVLLASFHAFLHRLTGRADIIVGTPTFARSKAEFVSVVGDFVNPVALRARLDPDKSGRELIAQLREVVHGALDAQEFPLPLLVERLQPERTAGRTPLFDTFFILQRFDQFRELEELLVGVESTQVIERGPLRLAAYPLHQQEGQFDLALQMAERAGVLHGVFKYSTDLFELDTIARWATDYLALVEAFVGQPDAALQSLPKPAPPTVQPGGALALLASLEQRDIRLALDGERLKVNAPKGALDAAAKAQITEHKAALIEALRTRERPAGGSIRRLDRGGPLPVSSAQQRFWFLDQMDPGRPDYNIGLGVRFGGPLDVESLRRALVVLMNRHESLHMRIVGSESGPVAELLSAPELPLEIVSLETLAADAREAQMQHLFGEFLRQPFELGRGPLCRFVLVRLGPTAAVLAISMHHAVSDGWSIPLAVGEICRIYESFAAGREPVLAPLAVQYPDYAGWERESLNSGRMSQHLSFWKRQLADVPVVLEMPLDRPRPPAQSFRGQRLRRYFDAPLVQPLKDLSRREGATLFMTLLAAWQVLLHRYSGQDDVTVGSPVANRSVPALEGLIGCLVNNVVLRGNLAGNPSFREFLARTKQSTLDAFDHCELPFDVLVEGLNPRRTASHAPLFQVMFTFLSFPTRIAPPSGLTLEMLEADTRAARFDLTIEVIERDGVLSALYEYATDLFDEATISRLHNHYEALLHSIVTDVSLPVGALPLLTTADRDLLGTWNATSVEHDRGRCVHELLEISARATPDEVAVTCGEESMTYGQLNERANRLSHLLKVRGVGPGALVGVCLDRTVDMPVALAAVLKAGGAYVPLDPTHPAERLSYTLQDAAVTCVITLTRFAEQLADARAPLLALDELSDEIARQPATAPGVATKPSDLAYVIYTSGSTGRPKGVEVEHRNVVSFLEAMRLEPGIGAKDVLLAVTTLSFDIAGLEMWLPLTVGARIVIASRTDVLDGHRLMELMETHRVTMLQATPATWRLLLEAGWAGRPTLKGLCGGEALQRDLAAALVEKVGELWNVYGPTETTIWSTVHRVRDPHTAIPIGHPIANTRVHVLEPSGQPSPVGVAGELCIGGEGVARGYRNRPELTAEKFVTVSLPQGGYERVYRTGDMARFRADGALEFLGRRDTQVKVRGYRIELGEIEAVLATHGGVKECVVVVREDIPGDQRLVGYVVSTGGARFEPEAARFTLRAKLPEYMVPNLFMTLDALPQTPNGKIDRKALRPPQALPAQAEDPAADEVLMTPPQRRVAALWRDLLGVRRVGLHDNFFDSGGHSLLLVKLQGALKREFVRDIALVELFQRTTVASQAERMSSNTSGSDALKRAQARAMKQANA